MAQRFMKTDGDLRAVMETMFSSTEFFSEGAWESKIKSPLEMVVGAVRALNAETNDTFALVQKVEDLGEPLYGKLEPTGYSNNGDTAFGSILIRYTLRFPNGQGRDPRNASGTKSKWDCRSNARATYPVLCA